MKKQIQRQQQQQPLIPYRDSKTAFNYFHSYFKSLHTILDYSSIGRNSVLYYLLAKERSINATMIEILAKLRKNASLYYKSEINCMNPVNFFATSPKQYSLDVRTQDLTFSVNNLSIQIDSPTPYKPHDVCTDACSSGLQTTHDTRSILKIKGLKRNLAGKLVTSKDFQRTAEYKCYPRTVVQHSIRRKNRRIFIIAQSKVSLTNLNTKQYFATKFSNKRCYFSFPLYLKSIIES